MCIRVNVKSSSCHLEFPKLHIHESFACVSPSFPPWFSFLVPSIPPSSYAPTPAIAASPLSPLVTSYQALCLWHNDNFFKTTVKTNLI